MIAVASVVHRRYQVATRVELTGAEPRPVPYTRKQRMYQPTIVELNYSWDSDDDYQYAVVTIHGRRVLVNGEDDGATETECLWHREQWPVWVRDLVEAHRPPADAFVGSTP